MQRGPVPSLTAVVAAVLLFAAGAGAATLAVSASPPRAGTPAAPRAETLGLSLGYIGYVNNKPSQTLVSVQEQLPPGFNNRLALFPSCPASEFADVGNTPPPCPAGSQTGTISFKAYVPSLGLTASAAGNIYRSGDNAVYAWVLAQIPGYKLAVAVPGKLTDATRLQGPSVTLDLSAAINFGVTADITDLTTTWNVATIPVTTTVTTPSERAALLLASPSTRGAAKKTTTVIRNEPESVFETSACPATDSWSFGAGLTYKSADPEAVGATIACVSATSTSTVPEQTTSPGQTTSTPSCIQILTLCLRRNAPSDGTRLRAGVGPPTERGARRPRAERPS